MACRRRSRSSCCLQPKQSSQVKSSQVKSSQFKSIQVKSRLVKSECPVLRQVKSECPVLRLRYYNCSVKRHRGAGLLHRVPVRTFFRLSTRPGRTRTTVLYTLAPSGGMQGFREPKAPDSILFCAKSPSAMKCHEVPMAADLKLSQSRFALGVAMASLLRPFSGAPAVIVVQFAWL